MQISKLFAVAAFATFASFGAYADEADGSDRALQFTSTRTAAEVRAEALNPIKISNGSTGVFALEGSSSVDRMALRKQTLMALRDGQTSHGEIGLM